MAKTAKWEDRFELRPEDGGEAIDYGQYIQIEDNGADVTIVSFAGMAILFAGMPQFEFRRILRESAKGCNLVFVRDMRRTGYLEAPDGTATGADFYTRLVGDALERLGSTYNIALGASAGGAEAFYLASRLPIHQIITFAPAFPPEVYLEWRTQLATYFNIRQLLREPAAYFEVLLVTLGGVYLHRRASRLLGKDWMPDITASYQGIEPEPPRATIFYGERSIPDRNQALMHQDIPQIHVRPLPTGRHNCAGFLKKRGQLGEALSKEIEAGRSEWASKRETADPNPRPEETA